MNPKERMSVLLMLAFQYCLAREQYYRAQDWEAAVSRRREFDAARAEHFFNDYAAEGIHEAFEVFEAKVAAIVTAARREVERVETEIEMLWVRGNAEISFNSYFGEQRDFKEAAWDNFDWFINPVRNRKPE